MSHLEGRFPGAESGEAPDRRGPRWWFVAAALVVVLGGVGLVAAVLPDDAGPSPFADDDPFELIQQLAVDVRDTPRVRLRLEVSARQHGRELAARGVLAVDHSRLLSHFVGTSHGIPVEQIVHGTTAYLRFGNRTEREWLQVDVEHARGMLEPVAPILLAGVGYDDLMGIRGLSPVRLIGTERHRGHRVTHFQGWSFFSQPRDRSERLRGGRLAMSPEERAERLTPTHDLWVSDDRQLRRVRFDIQQRPPDFRIEADCELDVPHALEIAPPDQVDEVLPVGTQVQLAELIAERLGVSLDHLPSRTA